MRRPLAKLRALVLAVTLLDGCAGLSKVQRTEECTVLADRYDAWGAVSVGASAPGLAGAAAAFGLDDRTERRVAAAVSAGSAVVYGVAVFLRDRSLSRFNDLECGTSTVAWPR